MPNLSEDKLKEFSKKEHKKYVKQAVIESVVALLPLVALVTGFVIIYTRPDAQELMSPARAGILSYAFPVLLVAYVVFLGFAGYDIRKRMKQK